MGLAREKVSDDFQLDRTQFSVVDLTDPDDSVECGLTRPVEERFRANFCAGRMAIPTLARDFKEFLKWLNWKGVEYLLIGGYAVGIRGHIRKRSRHLGGCQCKERDQTQSCNSRIWVLDEAISLSFSRVRTLSGVGFRPSRGRLENRPAGWKSCPTRTSKLRPNEASYGIFSAT